MDNKAEILKQIVCCAIDNLSAKKFLVEGSTLEIGLSELGVCVRYREPVLEQVINDHYVLSHRELLTVRDRPGFIKYVFQEMAWRLDRVRFLIRNKKSSEENRVTSVG